MFPGTGLGIESIGLGVELLRGEQRTSKCFLFVTTRPMSLLRNSSTFWKKKKDNWKVTDAYLLEELTRIDNNIIITIKLLTTIIIIIGQRNLAWDLTKVNDGIMM